MKRLLKVVPFLFATQLGGNPCPPCGGGPGTSVPLQSGVFNELPGAPCDSVSEPDAGFPCDLTVEVDADAGIVTERVSYNGQQHVIRFRRVDAAKIYREWGRPH